MRQTLPPNGEHANVVRQLGRDGHCGLKQFPLSAEPGCSGLGYIVRILLTPAGPGLLQTIGTDLFTGAFHIAAADLIALSTQSGDRFQIVLVAFGQSLRSAMTGKGSLETFFACNRRQTTVAPNPRVGALTNASESHQHTWAESSLDYTGRSLYNSVNWIARTQRL